MPSKFRKNVWVKRGDYVLVEPIEEGDKVKAEMVRILTPDHIKYFKKDNAWPAEFDVAKQTTNDEDDLFINTNRLAISDEDSSDDVCSEDSSESDASTDESEEN
ncbi:probable RNA-binding protein EIF1AD [Aethina tumida]|uniref:probable RNA-binding protein EIF1AD n=1 Tax=Aethina tumida TaxID=116153 RepID=UPI00096B5448|nr:probable RNA-binding protein EIF1AD [Aethina tumida]